MTAPDPGLTDLIAAMIARHRLRYGSEDAYHGARWLCTNCDWLLESATGDRPNATVLRAHANHIAERLKLVVEQHNNRRTAEERLAEALKGMDRLIIKLDETANGLGEWHEATEYVQGARKEVQEIYTRAALEGES